MSNNFIATAAAMNASAQASAAASAAREARDASEEALETKARFILLPIAKFESVETGEKSFFGMFSTYNKKLVGVKRTISIKTTDVANLETEQDDYGATYVVVNLEDRSEIMDDGDTVYHLKVPMSLSDVTDILNGTKQYKG